MQKSFIDQTNWMIKSMRLSFKKISLCMKLCVLFLICSISLAYANDTYAQKTEFSITVTNQTVKSVLKEIENNSDFDFFFSNKYVDVDRIVSISTKNENVFKILDRLFAGTDVVYSVLDKKIILTKKGVSDQNELASVFEIDQTKHPISGKVLDSNGDPIIGANVLEKGTTNGTITDYDGNFSLEVRSNATLEVSFVGYKTQQIGVSGKNSLNITLAEDSEALDEVVVIGYGMMKKKDLTGAVSSVSGEKITAKNTPQLSSQLQGQIAGVQITRSSSDPSAGATIRVRGITTMSTNDPLVIVDGVPGNINDIASEDVKNIQVLKDAASAAIYGSRAAAGVILITTKRATNKDFKMSYNIEYGIDAATEKPRYANIVEWMKGYNEYRYNDGASSLYSAYSEDLINNYSSYRAQDPDSYPDTNWINLGLHKTTAHQRHAFSLSGGIDNIKTNFSLNYYNANALYDYKNYEKFNARSNNDWGISNWIHANVDLNLTYIHQRTPHNMEGSVMRDFMARSPLFNAYWTNGTYADAKDGDNPLAAHELGGPILGRSYKFSGKIQLDLTPIKNLTLSAVAAPTYYFYKGKNHRKKYTVYNISGNKVTGSGFGSTTVTETRNDTHSLTMQFYANYRIQLDRHSINGMVGYEDYSYNWENERAYRTNYNLVNFPYLNLGPEDYQYNSGSAGHNAYRSIFGRIMYSWADRYMLQANIRSDGSSRFAKGHRWGTFPSVSLGWVISEEPWFEKDGITNYLKIRASIGQLGNERIGSEFPYQAALTFGTGLLPNASTGSVDVVQTAYQTTYAFNNITWETTTTYGVGVDLIMLNNRLRFSGDYYYKKTTDMLLTIGFPSYFGYNSPENNAADMHTKGWDLESSWNDMIDKVKYGASFNISDYRSKMGCMADRQVINGNMITEKGSYYNEFYGYKSKGIILNNDAMYDTNGKKIPVLTNNDKAGCIQYTDIDGDGIITASNDRIRLGNSLPEYQFGGSLWAEWNNFDFNLSFQGIGHQNVYWNWAITPFNYQAYSCPSILIDSHWSPSNSDAENAKVKYPMLTSNLSNTFANSDFYIFNGKYLRVKNITLGYTIPSSFTKKFSINKLRLYFSANDLPAFSNYPKGYDPEWNQYSDLIMSSYIFGLNVTF